ncbi:MAG: TIR domain-containing protein [Anaerolineales bacterium]|nr:TIR domain-containing protein [Anaerolineales bacterium]
MAEKNGSRKTKIFISYSRKNKLFVRKLNKAMDENGFEAWVDWEGIPLSADWMAEITAAIEASDTFVFVISPDSLNSKVCMDELELAIKYNKKIIPVLYGVSEKKQKLHPKLASTNWVYMRPQKDDFKATVPKLIESIQTDLGWVQKHTRLLQRATEWEQKERNKSYLLQGSDLSDGEHWMTESTKDAARAVVLVQAEYISASRKDAVKRQRNLTIGVGIALALSILLGIYAFNQSIEARKSRDQAEASQKVAEASQKVAEANEQARATQQAVAEEQKIIADANAQKANAQRSASEAKIHQDRVGELHTSTLLALDAYQRLPNLPDAENILRNNISLLPIPVKQMNVDARIWTIQPSPDQEKFVTVDSGGKACIWSMEDGSQFLCAQHDGIVYDSVMSQDGSILVTGTEKGIVTFWNANTGEQIKSLQFDGAIWDLNLHPNGRWLGAGRSNAVSIIDMKDMNEELYFTQNGDVKTIAFDESGAYMAIGTSKGYVSIWTVMGTQTIAGPKHDSEVIDLEFSPDSKWLVSVGADSAARAAQTAYGGQKYSIKHGDWVEDVTFGPDSAWFVTVSDDNTVRVIDTATGQERLRMTQANFVQKVRVSKDGQWIATTGHDQTVRIWDSATGAEVMRIPIEGIGSSIRFNKDSTRLIAGDRSGHITLWDVSQLNARKGFIQYSDFLHDALFSPNGEWLAVNSDDANIWLIKSDQLGNKEDNRQKLVTANGLTYDMAVSADSNWIAAVEYDSNIAEYNRVILASVDGTKKFFLSHDTEVINTVSFTPDSKQVVTADENGLICAWNVENGEKSLCFNTEGVILSIAVSPNGNYLVAGMDGNHSIVWDLTTQAQAATLEQVGGIKAVQYIKDGKLLATGSSEATVYLWNVEDGSFNRAENILVVNGEILSLELSPDDKQLAVGDTTGYVYLFDLALNQEVARLPHVDKVTSVSFSPDGSQLASVARKTVLLWDVPSIPLIMRDKLMETACSRLITNFDRNKWKLLFFEEEYRLICPNLPAGEN